MKVLINFKPTKEKLEEYPIIQILKSDDVFLELPLAAAEFGVEYEEPVLFGNIKGIPLVVEKWQVQEQINRLEMHHFKLENEKLIKVPEEESSISLRLPKGTNTDQLIMDNGQVVWAKPQESAETEEVEENGNS